VSVAIAGTTEGREAAYAVVKCMYSAIPDVSTLIAS
jgi:hypothetical protein